MRRDKIIWSAALVVSLVLLILYCIWSYYNLRNFNLGQQGTGYYGNGIMNRWFNSNNNQQYYSNKKKLSIDQIRSSVGNYIQKYGNNLQISDIFIFKDTDYYASIEEKDTGKGAMELLINPYSGNVYPENGPNMMWNEKYGMHGPNGYGMMGAKGYYHGNYDSKQINRDDAVKTADSYVKSNLGKQFSVPDQGHEFYGYYTFHVSKDDKQYGMLSVNYHTGDVWYHNWHGQLENIISYDEK